MLPDPPGSAPKDWDYRFCYHAQLSTEFSNE